MELATAMATSTYFWSSVLNISSPLPTPCSGRRIGSGQHGGYALTRQRDMKDILHISADCYTVHRLVHCKVAFAFESPPKGKVSRRRNCKCTKGEKQSPSQEMLPNTWVYFGLQYAIVYRCTTRTQNSYRSLYQWHVQVSFWILSSCQARIGGRFKLICKKTKRQ